MSTINIREISGADNLEMARVIRKVLEEFNVPKVGTAYEDPSLDALFEYYQNDLGVYLVLEENNKIIGGAGIGSLPDSAATVCELQKMYFLPEARGRGLGSLMIDKCLTKAKELGYTQCYLETMPYMEAARKLYRKNGFVDLDQPLGNTGHFSCSKWMLKEL